MDILPENKRILARRFPEVLKRIYEYNLAESIFKLKNSSNGYDLTYKDLLVYGKNKEGTINRWIRGVNESDNTFYAVTGFGTGEHISMLLKENPNIKHILIAEENISLIKKVFSTIDCSSLLEDPRILLSVGAVDSGFFSCMSTVHYKEINQAIILIFSPLYSTHEDYYSNFVNEFTRSFQYWKKLYSANLKDAQFVQEMSLKNIPYLLDAPDIEILKDSFKDMPITLVGAGPSLDLSIDFLKSISEKSVIVSVNTSYRKLINCGIKPHITLAVDPRKSTAKGYYNINTDDAYLICPYCVNEEVPRFFKNRIFTWSTQNPIPLTLRKRLGKTPGSYVAERGTVSTCIIDLAKLWGSKKIIMVGQDFAYTAEGKTHTSDSFYKEEGNLIAKLDKNTSLMPGNTLKEVYVEERLGIYLSAFEQLIDENPDIEFINTAPLGAKVRGAHFKTFDSVTESLNSESNIDVKGILQTAINKYNSQNENKQPSRSTIRPTITFINSLFKKSLEAAMHCEFLRDSYNSQSYYNHPDLKRTDQYADEVNTIIDSSPGDYEILFHGSTKRYLIDYQLNTEQLDDSNPWERAMKNKEFFWAITQGCDDLKSDINKYVYASN